MWLTFDGLPFYSNSGKRRTTEQVEWAGLDEKPSKSIPNPQSEQEFWTPVLDDSGLAPRP
ncbi:hypothetical protein N7448_001673 [Penicillium atrosanguineum]|nr:hypothetical protein N7526_004662 [Penicillium atrosanguineum]KAJ5150095.1 hypothetical protein N7448_001673 [Penicillium atrosanguineum]